jgi:hypothetical protein
MVNQQGVTTVIFVRVYNAPWVVTVEMDAQRAEGSFVPEWSGHINR